MQSEFDVYNYSSTGWPPNKTDFGCPNKNLVVSDDHESICTANSQTVPYVGAGNNDSVR